MLTFRYLLAVVAAVAATVAVAAAVLGVFKSNTPHLVSAAASILAGETAHVDAPVSVRQYLAYYRRDGGRWVLNDAGGMPVYILELGQCRPNPPDGADITGTGTAAFKGNNTQDLRSSVSLKIFDLTSYWRSGHRSVTVYVNPARASFTLSAPSNAFADFLLAWEDCLTCDSTYGPMYVDEVWRLTFTPSGPVLTRIRSSGGYWHEVYADGQLIYAWNKQGPKNNRYTGSDPSISVRIMSPDSRMNAEAAFTKVCAWS